MTVAALPRARALAADWADRTVDALLMLVVLFAPLWMGGRQTPGQFVLVALVSALMLCWLVSRALRAASPWQLSGVEWLLAGGLMLIGLQLIPLPAELQAALSPSLAGRLTLWRDAAPLGFHRWQTLSLMPAETRVCLVLYLAYVMLFLVVVNRLHDRRAVGQCLRLVAIAAAGMAGLGLLQLLAGNGDFLWIYDHPFRDTHRFVKGSFSNQNHCAQFLSLGLGPLIFWFVQSWRGECGLAAARAPRPSGGTSTPGDGWSRSAGGRSFQAAQQRGTAAPRTATALLGLALVLTLFAGLLTFSRGGVVAMVVTAAVSVAMLVRAGALPRRAVWALGGVAAVVAAAVSLYGYQPLMKRLSTFHEASSLEEFSRGRQKLWAADLQAVPDFWRVGAGIGTHRQLYPLYLAEDFGVDFSHAENGYLQLLLEGGVPALVLVLVGFAIACSWCGWVLWRSPDPFLRGAAGVILAGLAGSMVHSVGDFVWYIPACMTLTVILAACACRVYQLARSGPADHGAPGASRLAAGERGGGDGEDDLQTRRQVRIPRLGWMLGALVVAVLGSGMTHHRWGAAVARGHWDRYFRRAAAVRDRNPGEELTDRAIDAMILHLENVLRHDPHHDRAQLRLAALYLRKFERDQSRSDNPMPLAAIRDAAIASRFTSQTALYQWLAVAVGQRVALLDRALQHSQQALQLCPLHGEAYVYLAELTFLRGLGHRAKRALIDQGLAVRPHAGRVLFAAGGEFALEGNDQEALRYWKRAFHQDDEMRRLIISLLAPQLPVGYFVEQFEPGTEGLGLLFWFYHKQEMEQAAQKVGRIYGNLLEQEAGLAERSPAEAVALWRRAQAIWKQLGDHRQALSCCDRALQLAPHEYLVHRVRAETLLALEDYASALDELHWCRRRRPDDPQLEKLLAVVHTRRRSRVRQAARTSEAAGIADAPAAGETTR